MLHFFLPFRRGELSVYSKKEANLLSSQRKSQSTSESQIFRLFFPYIPHSLSYLFLTTPPHACSLPLYRSPPIPTYPFLLTPTFLPNILSIFILSPSHPPSSILILFFFWERHIGWKIPVNSSLSSNVQPIFLFLRIYSNSPIFFKEDTLGKIPVHSSLSLNLQPILLFLQIYSQFTYFFFRKTYWVKNSSQFFIFFEGESYIVLFHISQFDCFLFTRDIKNLSMTPETCQAYHTLVWDVSARYTVCEL